MRVLLTGLPIRSHLVPALVPMANALRRAGHEVAIATGGAMRAELERLGVPVLVLPEVLAPEEIQPETIGMPQEQLRGWCPELSGPISVPLFHEGMTATFTANLLDVAEPWRPDVIVRETNEYGGFLAAEILGAELAVLDIAPLIVRLVPDLVKRLNVVRAKFGLPAIASLAPAYGRIVAGLLPESWYPQGSRTSRHRCYRLPDQSGDPLDASIAELPADAPLVLMSLGSNVRTLLSAESRLLTIAAEALGRLPIRAVVALGHDPAAWTGPRPANVCFVPYVQQQLLLGACDVFLTHAGFSGIREALSRGVPMTALPLFADQPANAARVEELGAGIQVDTAGLTPDKLASALSQVMDKPSCRLAARGLQRQILALPSLDRFAADLEGLR
ncbi:MULTISPECIES: glycosyltransferase [Amycolatopsis]|uniref:Glycosyltransferase family 1 protein n=1 Tax=Amycolatopsis dendrobii TaxID=2760662 RepID=A0A7W3VSD7_9PSEU|nr:MULTISPECIES: glycosyltransferase [Amycolatopsis]MBB1152230.1 glycosyltransferase family 1 protein [Amycolatopsis dendrobii]UKD57496.1 glycosyltransferase [Amycolatopsis sp. FU40]